MTATFAPNTPGERERKKEQQDAEALEQQAKQLHYWRTASGKSEVC